MSAPEGTIRRWLPAGPAGQLRRNMAAGLVAMVINVALVVVSYPVYLHHLGLEQYGVWLVLSTVLTLAQVGNLGIAQAVTKVVAEEHARGDVHAMEAYARASLLLLGGAGVVVAVAVTLARAPIAGAFRLPAASEELVAALVPYLAALSVYVALTQVSSGVLAGLGRMDQANYIQVAGRVVALGASWMALRAGFGVASLLAGNTASYLMVHLWTSMAVRRIVTLRPLRGGPVDSVRLLRLLRFGGGIFGSALLGMFLLPLNRLLLSRYAGVGSLPVFEIAYTGAAHVRSLFEAGLRALMPEFSRAAATGAHQAMRALRRKSDLVIWVAAAPAYAALAAVAPAALPAWLGASFAPDQVLVFEIMLAGSFLSLLGVPTYYYFLGRGAVRVGFYGHVVQSGASLLLALASIAVTSSLTAPWAAVSVSLGFGLGTLYLAAVRRLDDASGGSTS